MRVLIVYNKDFSKVIFKTERQVKEIYPEKTIKKIADVLEKSGHYVEIADGNIEIIDRLRNFFSKGKGIVFNLSYGIQGEDRYAHIPGLLEMLGVPYTGSTPEGHTLALNKVVTKILLKHYGIPTPDFWVFSSEKEDLSSVKFPAIVKPIKEALSLGIRVVYNKDQLRKAIKSIRSEFKQAVVVEKFIRGREFSVGLLGNGKNLIAFPVLEFDFGGDLDAIQTTFLKRHKPIRKICPANISEKEAYIMQELSKKVFNVTGLRDYARTDIRMDIEGNIYVLEVNSQASLGETGSFYHGAKAYGFSYADMIQNILKVAIERYPFLEK